MSNEEFKSEPHIKPQIISGISTRNADRTKTQKITGMLLDSSLKYHLGALDEKEVILNEVKSLKRRLNKSQDANTFKAQMPVMHKDEAKIKLHSANENIIDNDTIVYYYAGKPVYVDFLNIEEHRKRSEVFGDNRYMNKIIEDLTRYKWGTLKDKDKLIYLYNKAEYYNQLIPGVEKSKSTLENLIQTKNKEIKDLQELIHTREQENLTGSHNKLNIMKKKDNLETVQKELLDFPKMIEELEIKLQNCDKIIKNYENPADGLSINEIISQIKEEKTRLNSEIGKQNEIISELDEEIQLLEESIKVLDF